MAFWPILMKLGNILILFQYFKSLLHNLIDQFSARTGDGKNCCFLTILLAYCESLVTDEVDSGIQTYCRGVQLFTFNILVIL